MKVLLLSALMSISTAAFALGGPKTVSSDGGGPTNGISLLADGTCVVNGFSLINDPAPVPPGGLGNGAQLLKGKALCRALGLINTTGLTQITGTYGNSYRAATDVATTACRIDSSGIDKDMATCGTANP